MTRFPRRRRIMLWTAATLLLLAMFSLLGITALLNSETASRRLLQHASGYAGVEIGRISGTLVTGMKLEQVQYNQGATDVRIKELSFDWQPWALLYGTCKIGSLHLDGVRIRYTSLVEKPAPQAKQKLADFALPLRISLAAADVYDLQLDYKGREFVLDHAYIDAALGHSLVLNELRLQAPVYGLTASGSIDGRFPYTGELTVQWQYRHNSSTQFAGTADIRGDIQTLELEHQLTVPAGLKTTGRILPGITGDRQPRVELLNQWSGLQLQPPLLPFSINNSAGAIQVSGWLDNYSLHGEGELQSDKLPPLQFALDATGNRNGLQAKELQIETLQGKIAAAGAAQWAPAFEWRADIAATDIDLRSFHPQLPEKLQLAFHTAGARTADRWRGSVRDIRGAGSIHSHPLRLQGKLEFDGDSILNSSLKLVAAESTLTLSGGISQQIDLRWQLDAPRLSALWPELEGTLRSSGRITGSRNSPRLQAAITGENLVYADYRMRRLHADLQTENPQNHVLTLTAERIIVRGRTMSGLNLNARGNAAKHTIESRIYDDYITANVTLDGGYRHSRWQGQLRRSGWQLENLPAWSLQQPVDIAIGAGGIRIGTACWSYAEARLCTQLAAVSNGNIRGEASLAAVPAALLDPWLPARMDLGGLIDGSLSISGRTANPTAELQLQARSGEVGVRRDGMPMDVYRCENAMLKADLKNRLLTATAGLAFTGYGAAESSVSINLHGRTLNGDLAARFDNLAPLQTVIPGLDELRGQLQATLKLAGTFDRPLLSGTLALQDASTRIPRWGVQIRNIRFNAHSDRSKNIVFTGAAESGDGHLELNGKLIYGKAPVLEASVAGENFEILRLPHIQAHINPKLDVEAGPKRINVQGAIGIPSAQINMREPGGSTVSISEDVIILDETYGVRESEALQLSAHVRLILGEDIQFQGFGFNAGLAGQLMLDKIPDRPLVANGELTVKKGQYKAFGQKLEIERGRLLFQGTPDNPGLDILAVRVTPDVTVNLEIEGTLENPRSHVYSDPPLPDSEAMAILLTGKPLGSASKSDANSLVNAITGLGLRKGQFITDEIARTFNLDEFKIKTESNVTASSLFIGKRISPKLFIRYIVGLFDQSSKIGLSYELTRQLRLEAESGWNQSMDLIYEIER